MIFLAILSTALSLYYFFFLLRVRRGLNKLASEQPGKLAFPFPASDSPLVSLIIAARNEERSIKRCLESVLQQDYPNDRYEILVVDDGSEDRTAEIVRGLSAGHPRLRLLSFPEDGQETGGRKPKAIAMAIRQSKGEIILTTDADCMVPRGWISGMVQFFSESTSFVAGPVVEQPEARMIALLSRIEFFGLIATGAGLIGAGRPIICNGANLGYRKSAFIAVGGFGEDDRFCDDETLMQRINTRNAGSVAFSGNPETIVETSSPASFKDFWQQRLRWASKKGHYEDRSISVSLILLYFSFLTFLLLACAAPFRSDMLLLFLFLLASKLSLEYSVLSKAASLFNQQFAKRHFLIAELFHVPYIVAAGFLGQFSPLQWKGKRIRR